MSFLSDEQLLRWGQWWFDRQETLRRCSTAFFGVLVITALVVGLAGVGWWAIVDTIRGATLVKGLERVLATPQSPVSQPFALESGDTSLFWENGRAHVLSFVRNSNPRLWANFRYQFILDGLETPWRKTSVFPDAKRPVIELGISMERRPSSVQLMIDAIEFHRANPHRAPLVGSWIASQNAIDVLRVALLDTQPSMVEMELANRTIYNLRSVPIVVILWRGESPVGATLKTIDDFRSDTRRTTTVVWNATTVPFHTRITAAPIIEVDDVENRSAF